jgi:plastocyanin
MTRLPRRILWPAAAVFALALAFAWKPLANAAERRERPAPVPIADTGGVTGRATFSAARPKQPIIVWLERDGGELKFTVPPALQIGQRGAQFSPSFAVVVAGQKVVFNNDEDKEIDHNVYTLGAEKKDFDIFPKGKSVDYSFTKTGEVSLYCSVHKLMDGKLFVAPSLAYAEIADDGSFTIPNVAPGTYTLKTYQKAKRFRDVEFKVVVKAGETANVTVEMKR